MFVCRAAYVISQDFSAVMVMAALLQKPAHDQGDACRQGDGGNGQGGDDIDGILAPKHEFKTGAGKESLPVLEDQGDDRIDNDAEQTAQDGADSGFDLCLELRIADDKKESPGQQQTKGCDLQSDTPVIGSGGMKPAYQDHAVKPEGVPGHD